MDLSRQDTLKKHCQYSSTTTENHRRVNKQRLDVWAVIVNEWNASYREVRAKGHEIVVEQRFLFHPVYPLFISPIFFVSNWVSPKHRPYEIKNLMVLTWERGGGGAWMYTSVVFNDLLTQRSCCFCQVKMLAGEMGFFSFFKPTNLSAPPLVQWGGVVNTAGTLCDLHTAPARWSAAGRRASERRRFGATLPPVGR